MKDTAHEILGKTITGICIRYSAKPQVTPCSQLFLVFDDGSSYEFYCYRDDIRPTGGLSPNQGMKQIDAYMKGAYFDAYRAEMDAGTGLIHYQSRDR
jgi:hypothetical protein